MPHPSAKPVSTLSKSTRGLANRCINRLPLVSHVGRPQPQQNAIVAASFLEVSVGVNTASRICQQQNPRRDPNTRSTAILIRAFQGTHIHENRWGDIGYHFLIDPAGRVWEGRDLRYQGAHAGGVNNEHNVGICLLGRFVGDRSGQAPPAAQVRSMEGLVAHMSAKHSISPRRIHTHKELKSDTNCPGSRLQAIVDRMRRKRSVAAAAEGRSLLAGGTR